MKKLIFEIFGLSFCVLMLYAICKEGLTTENNLVFPFSLFFLAILTNLAMIAGTISKLFSK